MDYCFIKKSAKKIIFAYLALPLLLIFSCSSAPKAKLHPVYVTDRKAVELLPPSASFFSIEAVQEFEGDFGGKSFSMMAYLTLNEKEISVSLLNNFGVDIGFLFYDGNRVSFESAFFPDSFKAEYIVADLQNAYYDFELLRKNYASSSIAFTEEKTEEKEGDSLVRRIYDGKDLIEEITIKKSDKKIRRIKIRNHLRNYTYTIAEVTS